MLEITDETLRKELESFEGSLPTARFDVLDSLCQNIVTRFPKYSSALGPWFDEMIEAEVVRREAASASQDLAQKLRDRLCDHYYTLEETRDAFFDGEADVTADELDVAENYLDYLSYLLDSVIEDGAVTQNMEIVSLIEHGVAYADAADSFADEWIGAGASGGGSPAAISLQPDLFDPSGQNRGADQTPAPPCHAGEFGGWPADGIGAAPQRTPSPFAPTRPGIVPVPQAAAISSLRHNAISEAAAAVARQYGAWQ